MASHFVLDGGNLVAAHAGMAERLQQTSCLTVNIENDQEVAQTEKWWHEETAAGGEGMVLKPLESRPRPSGAAGWSTCGSSTGRSTPAGTR